MEEISKKIQNIIELEVQNKSRVRGTRIAEDGVYVRLSSNPDRELTRQIREIVCNPKRKKIIKSYKEQENETFRSGKDGRVE